MQNEKSSQEQSDLDAIKALRQADMTASKNQDYETLLSLMTEDCIIMPPGQDVIRGKEAIRQMMKAVEAAQKDVVITEYIHDFEEIHVSGDTAYEWGIYRGAYLPTPDSDEVKEKSRLLRILRREPDGTWKVARAIWQELSSE